MALTEKMVEDIKSAIAEGEKNMISLVGKRDEQIREMGGVTNELKSNLEKQEKEIDTLLEDYKGLKTSLEKLEAEQGRPAFGSRQSDFKSLADRIIESGMVDQIKNEKSTNRLWLGQWPGMKDANGEHLINKLSDEEFSPQGRKSALEALDHVTASRFDGEGNRIIPALNIGTIPTIEQELTIEAMIPKVPISTDTIEYVQETNGFDNIRTLSVAAVAAGQSTIEVVLAEGYFVNQPIEIRVEGGTEETHRVAAVDYGANTITLREPLTANVPAKAPITSRYFSGQIEGGLKPWMGLRKSKSAQETIKTLAHAMPVTRQLLSDLPRLRAEINTKLLSGLDSNREYQILHGNGDERNLSGILNNPLRQTYRQSSGRSLQGVEWVRDGKIDTIRKAIGLSQISGVAPTSLMINPFDWEEIETTKDSEGRYLWTTPTEGAVQRLWRTPVITSHAIEPGKAILGNWNAAATLYVREGANVRMSEQHEDFFMRNMVLFLAEERVGVVFTRPESFVDITFDVAITAGVGG